MKHIETVPRRGDNNVNLRGCKVKRCTFCLVDIVYPDNIHPYNYKNSKYICKTCANKEDYRREKVRRKNRQIGDSQHITDMLGGIRKSAKKRGMVKKFHNNK